jgi:flagellar biosynthesis/type III secretory pathway M-ring protein FliF/YscJ
MPYARFLLLDVISCAIWALVLAGVGYFFSGAITNIIGDFKQVGIWLFFIVLFGIIIFYVVERYYLSEKVEEANPNPETIHKIEEKLHNIEERLHLTTSPEREEVKEKRRRGKEEKKTDAEARRRADAEKEESKSIGG